MTKALIYKPAATSMHSVGGKTFWILEFLQPLGSRFLDSKMGWTSSSDMSGEVKLKFQSLESAKIFAEQNGIIYEVVVCNKKKIIQKSYADNFLV